MRQRRTRSSYWSRNRLAEPDRLRGLALDENGALPAIGATSGPMDRTLVGDGSAVI